MKWRAVATALLALSLHVALTIVLLAAGLLAAWQLAVVGVRVSLSSTVYLGLASVVSGLGMIVLHELGHAVAARAVGFPLTHLKLVFLTLSRDSGGWHIRRNRGWFHPAGYVAHGGAAVGWRHAVMVAAGPAANLAAGVVCLLVAAAVNVPSPPPAPRSAILNPDGFVVGWLNVTGLISLGLAVATLAPGKTAGVRTDGGQLIDLLRYRLTGAGRNDSPAPTNYRGMRAG